MNLFQSWKDWAALIGIVILAVGLARSFSSEVGIRISWGGFWIWLWFDWLGYCGLACLAALKVSHYVLPKALRLGRGLWSRRGCRVPTGLGHLVKKCG